MRWIFLAAAVFAWLIAMSNGFQSGLIAEIKETQWIIIFWLMVIMMKIVDIEEKK